MRRVRAYVLAPLALVAGGVPLAAQGDEALVNPRLGDPAAVMEGRRIYRTRCVLCHGANGGRGPNLFAATISDQRFLETVINGRKGSLMPAFGLQLAPDDVFAVQAYTRSTDHYE